MKDDAFAADPEGLGKAGGQIADSSEKAQTILADLVDAIHNHPNAWGQNDSIAKAVTKTYAPGAEAGLKFLAGLTALLQAHGEMTTDLQGVLEEIDSSATSDVSKIIHKK